MSAVTDEDPVDEDLEDLLTDDLKEPAPNKAIPVRRTPAQAAAAAAKRAEAQAEADSLRAAQDATKAKAARLAQVVNLHIAGYSLADIGVAIGATEAEVDRMLAEETQRYVRSQPALRTYVRNWISSKYSELLDAVWDEATDKTHRDKLENSAQALRILDKMGRLHGAEAPVQSEVKVESAPEAVEQLVARLAAAQGLGYDESVFDTAFDTVPGQVVHDAVEQSHAALESSSAAVEESDGDDEF